MGDLTGVRLRPDFRRQQRCFRDVRSAERLIAHYRLERALSDRLRQAPREARSRVYQEVYQDLFAALPDHPQRLVRRDHAANVEARCRRLGKRLQPHYVFLEIGCGDAALSFAVAHSVRTAYGLDVTEALIDFAAAPANFTFRRTTGIDIPLPSEAVDFAYSNQLIEHLHPDDAADRLKEVWRVLKPGGRYMCVTPSRITGPHDISCFFDYQAAGLHLREYDYGSLRMLFRDAGFRKFSCSASARSLEIGLPYPLARLLERGLLALPRPLRASLTRSAPVRALMGLNAVAVK
ncbi:MAG TPA: methyltransferase domain-containing protein [Stellaceae bacterium]|nr:methyltransferase domain-containing protein [Stellaceae bacterium]